MILKFLFLMTFFLLARLSFHHFFCQNSIIGGMEVKYPVTESREYEYGNPIYSLNAKNKNFKMQIYEANYISSCRALNCKQNIVFF